MSQQNTDDERSEMKQEFDRVVGEAQGEFKEVTATAKVTVRVPKDENLLETAMETWEESDTHSDVPGEFEPAPEYLLKQRVAATKAKELFADKVSSDTTSLDVQASYTGWGDVRTVDGERVGFEVWEAIVYL